MEVRFLSRVAPGNGSKPPGRPRDCPAVAVPYSYVVGHRILALQVVALQLEGRIAEARGHYPCAMQIRLAYRKGWYKLGIASE